RPDDHRRRRAHRRPRPPERRRDPRPAREAQQGVQEDDLDGHARSRRGRARPDRAPPRQGGAQVNLAGVAAKNVLRNKFRSSLTIVGVAVAILAFVLVRTVLSAWTIAADFAAKDRIGTRHKVTFVMTLPKRYAEDIKTVPGVKSVTWFNWFGA